MVKKIIVLLVLFSLWGCTTPPVVTNTPAMTDTPTMTSTPVVTDIPTMTDTPVVTLTSTMTDTPIVPTVASGDAPYLPNPASQPGVYNPDVTQETIQSTICVSGYTSTIRPPVSYTDKLKGQQIVQYGYADL